MRTVQIMTAAKGKSGNGRKTLTEKNSGIPYLMERKSAVLILFTSRNTQKSTKSFERKDQMEI